MKLLIVLLLVSVSAVGVMADPGETDEKGGHYNRETGLYHYHTDLSESGDALRKIATIELQAKADAKRDLSSSSINVWYFAGLCLGPIGIASAFIIPSTVPADKLIGKSPEYVLYYSKAYKSEIRKERAKSSTIGFAVFGCLYLGDLYVW